MISVEGLKVEFGVKPLFVNASFVVNDRDRIALVGKNGAGKSTLLKILCGQQRPTEGVVAVPNDTTIGYLPQVMNLQDDTTVREETRKAFAGNTQMKERLDKMNEELSERSDYESDDYMRLVQRYTEEHERYMMMGAENYEAEIERTLAGLGFTRTDLDRPTNEFSGGWRMRIELAKILLQKPDVLLLDEPTNHLDIESIQWLEQFLAQSAKAVVLVSHDRAFINHVTNRTLEISCGQVIDYRVKYDEYVTLRAERREQQIRAYENQQKEMADMKAFIERFRYQATKAVQVQQKIKQLEKMVPIEIDEVDHAAMHLKFPPCLRSGDYPVICEEVRKDYGEHTVFDHVTFTIKRGEKVAFVGKNGEGKSTLVKCIMNEIPFTGTLKVGHQVQIGYFAQNQAQLLDESLTVFQTIDHVAKGEIRLRINDILGAFMFGGENAEKKVKVLSGGERSRLAMIKLLLEPVNLLILDEPTNHLDMQSKDVLKEAINAFDGTAIVVSHDREFLDGLVTKVYEFGGGRVREHLGGIYDFLRRKKIESLDELSRGVRSEECGVRNNECGVRSEECGVRNNECGVRSEECGVRNDNKNKCSVKTESQSNSHSTLHTPHSSSLTSKLAYLERKEQQKKMKRVEKSIKEVEGKITQLENRIKELDDILCTPEGASDMTVVTEYTSIKKLIDQETERWERLCEEMEEMKDFL